MFKYIFVFNKYREELYINKTETTTYLNIFWNPNNITNFNNLNYDDINNDFIRCRSLYNVYIGSPKLPNWFQMIPNWFQMV